MTRTGISIIGAPLDLGQGRRGVDMGPSAVRVANLGGRLTALGYDVADLGNIPAAQAESLPHPGPGNARFIDEIAAACRKLGELVLDSLHNNQTPLVLGGDHSI